MKIDFLPMALRQRLFLFLLLAFLSLVLFLPLPYLSLSLYTLPSLPSFTPLGKGLPA